MNIDHSGPDHLTPVVGEASQRVLLVVAEAVGDKEDGVPLRLLSVGRLLVLLAWQGEHKRRSVEVLHELRLLLDPLQIMSMSNMDVLGREYAPIYCIKFRELH